VTGVTLGRHPVLLQHGGIRFGIFAMARFCTALFTVALALTPPAAFAAPQDCSTAQIPATPVKGVVGGKPFIPNDVSVQITKDGMQIDAAKFDRYVLSLQTDGIFNALSVDAIFHQGTKPEGHIFRLLPRDVLDHQPLAAEGTPEIQGWDLQLESANVNTSFTQDVASLRLEYGPRKGDIIPGKIYFCVPSSNTEIMGTFNAKVAE
jgi:hypothetical protein